MKNKWTANLGLKIISILFAVALWLIATNINDPVIPWTVNNVPVKILNGALITNEGKVFEVLDGTDNIDLVTIRARRSVIDALSPDDVVATADMRDLSSLDTIGIKLSTTKYNDELESVRGSIDIVKLNIENKKTSTLELKAVTTGMAEEGYMIGDISTDQNLVRITGPESVISKVALAQVEVDVTGFTRSIGTDAEIKLYDAEGEPVPDGNIKKNIDSVHVNVPLLQTKRVPVNYKVSGKPAAGYRLTGVVESTPDTVLIAGKSNIIKTVSALEIPETVLDVTGKTADMVTIVDLKKYLPDGIILGDSEFSGKASVTIYIAPEVSRELQIPAGNLSVSNLPQGFKGEILEDEETYTVKIVGLQEAIDAVNAGSMAGVVDVHSYMLNEEMEELQEGIYTMPVTLSLPADIAVDAAVEVRVQIRSEE